MRATGFYWIQTGPFQIPTVAEWRSLTERWFVSGASASFSDSEVFHVLSDPLEPPQKGEKRLGTYQSSGLRGRQAEMTTDLTNLRLKVFPNPMRSDGVFVAEDKPIEPYEGARGINGPLYPAVPDGRRINAGVELDFAERIVCCVNYCAGRTNEELER